jgi:hypothetical protein
MKPEREHPNIVGAPMLLNRNFGNTAKKRTIFLAVC